jgi:phosphate:Na+ symporter
MFTNPFVGIIVGILFTAVLQSASASVGILQALSMTGAITFSSAYPIILGIGIGAAVPVLLSAVGTNNNGKRTALVYLTNDVLGMVIWGSIFYILNAFLHFTFMDMVMSPVLIAALNSVYRLLTVVVLFPFINYIEKLVFALVKDSEEDIEEQADFDLLEERFLQYPELAISQCHKAMNGMAKTADKNLTRSFAMLTEYSDSALEKVEKKEKLLDKYEDKLGTYLMQLSKQPMNSSETRQTSKFLHSITDFERLGDHAVNVAYVSQRLVEEKITFTKAGRKELSVACQAVEELIHMTCKAFQTDDVDLALRVEPLCDVISSLCGEMKSRHVTRLQKGQCGIEQGIVFHDLLNNFERISAHCSNIAIAVVESDASTFDPHAYLHDVKKNKNQAYLDTCQEYEEKYALGNFKTEEIPSEEQDKKEIKSDKKNKEKKDDKKKKKK